MDIGCIRDLNIDILEGVWKCGDMTIEIKPEIVIIIDQENKFKEQTKIEYLEGFNFVQISDSLIIKQIFNDNSISISYLGELNTFRKIM